MTSKFYWQVTWCYSKTKLAKMPQNMKSFARFRTVFEPAVLCELSNALWIKCFCKLREKFDETVEPVNNVSVALSWDLTCFGHGCSKLQIQPK